MSSRPVPLLTELRDVRQIPGELRRRGFASAELDLIVWYGDDGAPEAFQLCYDKRRAEHALTSTPERGFTHTAVEAGDGVGLGYKRAPVLVPNGAVDVAGIAERFTASCAALPADVVAFVQAHLAAYRAPA